MHVFLFSDHVSAADEVELKRRGAGARAAGHGPRLRHRDARRRRARLRQRRPLRARSGSSPRPARARRRRRCCSTARASGVSQIIGVGGRDLSADVGGIMFRRGDADARGRRRRPRRCCWCPSRRGPRPSTRSATSTSAASAWSPRSSAGKGRDGAVRDPPDARGRRVRGGGAGRQRSTPTCAATGRRRACSPAGPRSRGGDRAGPLLGSIGGNAGDGSRRRPRGSSTSARRSTRRAGRTRWSTSRCAWRCSRDAARRRRLRAARRGASGTARTPIPPAALAPALAALARGPAGDRPRVRHARRPAGRAPPGGDAARRRRARRADERGGRTAGGGRRPREDRDAHLLGEAARRRRARARGLRGAGAPRPRRRAVRARPPGRGRCTGRPRVPLHLVRHVPPDAPFDERILAMLRRVRGGPAPLGDGGFDIVHSQDCLSANAALDAARRAASIDHVIRTVHHVDDFTSPSLVECQDRSILEPDALLCVSQPWVERLATRLRRRGRPGRQRRRPAPLPAAARLRPSARRARARAGLGDRFTVLTVGGIEPRKGSLTLLEAFAALRGRRPSSTRCW